MSGSSFVFGSDELLGSDSFIAASVFRLLLSGSVFVTLLAECEVVFLGVAVVELHEESAEIAFHVEAFAEVEVCGCVWRLVGGGDFAEYVELLLALVRISGVVVFLVVEYEVERRLASEVEH